MNRIGIGLEHRQTLRLEHRLVITPQLQQAIKLLQLNHIEMADILQEELLENPMLEQQEDEDEDWDNERREPETFEETGFGSDEEESRAEAAQIDAQLPELLSPDDQTDQAVPENFEEVDWEAYFQDMEYSTPSLPSNREDFDADLPTLESRLTPEETMIEHLMQQLRLLRMDDDTREMAALIIGNLNEDGWLVMDDDNEHDPLTMLAEQMSHQERLQTGEKNTGGESLDESIEYWREIAEEALEVVQSLEPAGMAARTLQESLLIQLKQHEGDGDIPLLERLVSEHLKNLERRNFAAIGKKMRISLRALLDAAEQIAKMDPRPGRHFSNDPSFYITPDIYVRKVNDQYYITLNDDGLPKLKISQFYKQAMRGQSQGKEFIQEKLRNATWLLRSIHQRQQTIYKVTDSIVKRQRDFFDFGLEYLKPMILRDVAEDISMHESTVSRVTTNKYVHTPQGVFELKFFFTSSLQATDGGDDISSLTVKEKIKKMIADEDPRDPLSDQQIVKLLESESIQIARRTVAKYRNILNIPSSSRRKQLF